MNGLLIMLAVAAIGYFGGSRGAGMLQRAFAQGRANEVVPFNGAGQGSAPPVPYTQPGVSALPNPPLNSQPAYAPAPAERIASNPPRTPAATVNGDDLVAQAARRVQSESSVQAQIRFRIDVAGQNLIGNGLYVQLGDGPEKLLRFDLKLQVGQRVAALQQISGQQFYWIRRDLPPANHKVSRVNLRSIRNAVAKKHAAADRDSDLTGTPLTSPADDAWLLLGGLPALLESLAHDFDFGDAREGTIDFPGNDNRAARLPVWAVSGTWKPERLKQLTAATAKTKNATAPLLPQRVDLVLGRDERSFALFPYRVIYYATDNKSGAGQGSEINMNPIVSMEFFNVQTAANLDPRDFDYNPGEQEVEDLTSVYLQKLGLGK